MTKKEKTIRADQAAEILDCSVRHIYRLISEAHLKAFKIGRSRGLRIIEKSVFDFIDRQKSIAELEAGFRDPSDMPD